MKTSWNFLGWSWGETFGLSVWDMTEGPCSTEPVTLRMRSGAGPEDGSRAEGVSGGGGSGIRGMRGMRDVGVMVWGRVEVGAGHKLVP